MARLVTADTTLATRDFLTGSVGLEATLTAADFIGGFRAALGFAGFDLTVADALALPLATLLLLDTARDLLVAVFFVAVFAAPLVAVAPAAFFARVFVRVAFAAGFGSAAALRVPVADWVLALVVAPAEADLRRRAGLLLVSSTASTTSGGAASAASRP